MSPLRDALRQRSEHQGVVIPPLPQICRLGLNTTWEATPFLTRLAQSEQKGHLTAHEPFGTYGPGPSIPPL